MEQYDVFISCNSEDYDLANDVYNFLLGNDITCFFAGRNISESGNSKYREVIDNAIDKSDNMIVVGSSIDNINSEWVKAEWDLFINEQRSGRKRGNIITILKKGVRPEDLELSLRGVQSFSPDNYKDFILSYIKREICKKSPGYNLKQRGRVHKYICVTISFLLAIFACFFVMNRISPISNAKDLYIKSFKKQKKIELAKKWEELSAIANQMDSIYSVARKCSYLLEESSISKLPDIDEYIFEVRDGFDVPLADWGARIEEMDENIELSELNPNLINFVRSIEEYNQNHKALDSLFVFCDSLRTIEVPLEIRLIELRKIQCVSLLGSYKYIIILCGTFIGVFFLSYLISFMLFHFVEKSVKDREERKKNLDKKTGGKGIQTLEVDLHQDALCPGNHNMSAIEIHELQKRTIVSTLNQERHRHGKQIVFIHGKGDGTLRRELIAELKKRQAECTYEDASYHTYGIQGAIKVTIK